jgi:hypothetical protein
MCGDDSDSEDELQGTNYRDEFGMDKRATCRVRASRAADGSLCADPVRVGGHEPIAYHTNSFFLAVRAERESICLHIQERNDGAGLNGRPARGLFVSVS